MTDVSTRAREARARATALSQGLHLSKSRSRNPNRPDYGRFALLDIETGFPIHAALAGSYTHALSLEGVESWLAPESERSRPQLRLVT